jgi:uncharacterized membrane protein
MDARVVDMTANATASASCNVVIQLFGCNSFNITEDESSCMVINMLKLIVFVVLILAVLKDPHHGQMYTCFAVLFNTVLVLSEYCSAVSAQEFLAMAEPLSFLLAPLTYCYTFISSCIVRVHEHFLLGHHNLTPRGFEDASSILATYHLDLSVGG